MRGKSKKKDKKRSVSVGFAVLSLRADRVQGVRPVICKIVISTRSGAVFVGQRDAASPRRRQDGDKKKGMM